ncbi:MAG: 2-C-methyl-D-erythritol 4-phosphate cytidylyltransferase [Acidobacteria bacterium]|nr:MAG: 2-C-methyl-D-erythritol 4-phosphate cytidylyltransferase [Acidobacteriota bacterium]REK02239.1 MAG: 2-C-methyl-D-erythritol 4-phosphate cytidylyltransferase [Acidobacteriota bacterium]REK13958.1 MAG: 2-C-methyl-D-erythritol 4-phosphate cytidylyltransferase [Acidobacteriota bacterium]REK41953.1 MAG: 2-C-methyl-D-erythritol 4-phosphate cytidylyltransferase [Acidobacteriota bacterium]
MNSAIIVAAGQGSRFGGGRPKQFAEILGKPLLIHTVERFEKSRVIDEIVLVLASGEMREFSDELEEYDIEKVSAVVAGGDSRTESVMNGLSAVRGEESSLVAIHDGARPVLSQFDLENVLNAAAINGAACLVAAITDTVKQVADNKISGTLDRSDLRRALTPQCFRYEVIQDAFRALGPNADLTDDSSIAEAAGFDVVAIEGDPSNIKITYEQDLAVAEVYLKQLFLREANDER